MDLLVILLGVVVAGSIIRLLNGESLRGEPPLDFVANAIIASFLWFVMLLPMTIIRVIEFIDPTAEHNRLRRRHRAKDGRSSPTGIPIATGRSAYVDMEGEVRTAEYDDIHGRIDLSDPLREAMRDPLGVTVHGQMARDELRKKQLRDFEKQKHGSEDDETKP